MRIYIKEPAQHDFSGFVYYAILTRQINTYMSIWHILFEYPLLLYHRCTDN